LKEWSISNAQIGTTLVNQKFWSRNSYEQVEVRECSLSFGREYFVFQFVIQKYKDYDTQNYNFACCFVWV